MIRLIEDASVLNDLICGDLYKSKICALFKTYGFAPFMDYWQGYDVLICRIDNTFVAAMGEDCDIDEVASFIRVVCSGNVLCRADADICGKVLQTGKVMILNGSTQINCSTNNTTNFINIKKTFNLLSGCFDLPSFEDFNADIMHRVNKGILRYCGIYDGNKLISCAFANAVNNTAVIYSVATDAAYRHKGAGTAVVNGLLHQLNDCRKIFLQRQASKNAEFYYKLGFTDISDWKEITGET